MAAPPDLIPFKPSDRFLRRIRFPDHVKGGLVYWRAFKDGDVRLSLTFQDATLMTDTAIDEYRAFFGNRHLSRNLPGICWLSCRGLVTKIDPPLEPRHDPDDSDDVYGHLHCTTERPRDKAHMELLAKLVNDGDDAGLLRDYVRATR